MSNVLEVRGARRRFGDRDALDGVDLELARGEWVALLGPNGAGKTTLMRAIAGIESLDSGEIRPRPNGASSTVGFVPQEVALYAPLSARENLRLFGRMHGLRASALKRRVDWALGWTALEERADESVARLSGGMRRRLNIACGVLQSPDVLLLDEPTVGVDPQSRNRIWEMLRGLLDDGAAILQSTHELDEIEMLSDRIVVLDRGRVLARGSREELVAATLGPGASLSIELDRVPEEAPLAGLRVAGRRIEGRLADPASELPELLGAIHASGASVRGLRLREAGLREVFVELTGKELRE